MKMVRLFISFVGELNDRKMKLRYETENTEIENDKQFKRTIVM